MSVEVAFGWRKLELGYSSGLDFLGLAGPIEGILDAETSGITNATARARYFSLVPWYYWKYATRGGEGSARDQRRFAIGFEMLLAYANIAWFEQTGTFSTGIIRRDFCEKMWRSGETDLPLRGEQIGDTPSPLDAALYGPSLRRLGLLGRYGLLHTCQAAGQLMATELDKKFGQQPSLAELLDADTVDRDTVRQWAALLALDETQPRENDLLRNLLFSTVEFDTDELPPRVLSFLLMLSIACGTENWFQERDVEIALALGQDLKGAALTVEVPLLESWSHWRILALLKFLRHASELAFAAVHAYVSAAIRPFVSAEAAAASLIGRTIDLAGTLETPPERFQNFVDSFLDGMDPPSWDLKRGTPEETLLHAIRIAAWCQAVIVREHGNGVMRDELVQVGQGIDADLASYVAQMQRLATHPLELALRWLLVDRGIARHFQVAARKLAEHDTFRLIEDEGGVRATDSCPVAGVAIRIDSMLSLLADVRLLERSANGYRTTSDTVNWFRNQIDRLTRHA